MNQRGQRLKEPLNKDLHVIQASSTEEVHSCTGVAEYGPWKMLRGLKLFNPNSISDFHMTQLLCFDKMFQTHLLHFLSQTWTYPFPQNSPVSFGQKRHFSITTRVLVSFNATSCLGLFVEKNQEIYHVLKVNNLMRSC